MRSLAAIALFSLARLLVAQTSPTPTLHGFVTEPGTPRQFQVNGYQVLCTDGTTRTEHPDGSHLQGTLTCPEHFLGQQLAVYGTKDKARVTIKAEHVVEDSPTETPARGSALTDLVVRKSSKEVVVRADGYLLHITPDTRMTYESTLPQGFAAFQTNQWISYRGIAHPDGTVMVQRASLGPNVISDGEDKLRSKAEFDAAVVDDGDRQNAVSKVFTGVDRTRIPAYNDPDLQARINGIGTRLVPAYQRALPESDPSKINFRFQLVADSSNTLYPLSSDIVLLSHEGMARMQNDDQLAAILAIGIAAVLQKQEFRLQPAKHAMLAGQIAGTAIGTVIPGAGLVPLVVNAETRGRLERQNAEQDARESLCLLHDAGFDLQQAPLANWLVVEKMGKPMARTALPASAAYLYFLIGTAWRSPNLPLPQAALARSASVVN